MNMQIVHYCLYVCALLCWMHSFSGNNFISRSPLSYLHVFVFVVAFFFIIEIHCWKSIYQHSTTLALRFSVISGDVKFKATDMIVCAILAISFCTMHSFKIGMITTTKTTAEYELEYGVDGVDWSFFDNKWWLFFSNKVKIWILVHRWISLSFLIRSIWVWTA